MTVPRSRESTIVAALGDGYDTTRALRLESLLRGVDGVNFVGFNYVNDRVTVRFDPDRADPKKLRGIIDEERKQHSRHVKKVRKGRDL